MNSFTHDFTLNEALPNVGWKHNAVLRRETLYFHLQPIIFLCPLYIICSKTSNQGLICSIILANLDINPKASGQVLFGGFAYNLFFSQDVLTRIEMFIYAIIYLLCSHLASLEALSGTIVTASFTTSCQCLSQSLPHRKCL